MSDIQSQRRVGKIAIVKWDEFQHYKDRNPPWVKLHRSLLTSETWVCASNEGRLLAIASMMLAAATDNEIPANKAYFKRVAYLDFEPDFQELVDLGFLYWLEKPNESGDASKTLADASKMQADARPEKEAEAEQRREELSPKGDCASGDAPEDDFTISDFVESWNDVASKCGLPRISKVTDARRRAFNVRKRQYPAIDDWKKAFRCLAENDWMHGDNKNGWRADADFFLQAKSFTKLVEGAYAKADR